MDKIKEKLQPYMNSNYGMGLAGLIIALLLSLRAMGILAIAVAFWAGFASCILLELWAVYFFLLKFEAKTEAKLEQYVLKLDFC